MKTKIASAPKSIVSPGNFITVSVDDETYQITSDHPEFAKVEHYVKTKQWDKVFNILGLAKTLQNFTEGDVTFDGMDVSYKGKKINSYVTQKLIKMVQEGTSDATPLAKFLDKVMQSKYDHVKENLYKFLEWGNIPLTADGDFLGYKSVRADYKDVRTGTFDNSPGTTVRMERSKVVSDPSQGCSAGLHVGVAQYVSGFGGAKTIVVKVDPRNVVSVPAEYNHQKMRTCEYFVVGDFNPAHPLTSEVYQVTSEKAPVQEKSNSAVEPKQKAKIEKYIGRVAPLRDSNGRFIKKPVKTRDAKGRFIKQK